MLVSVYIMLNIRFLAISDRVKTFFSETKTFAKTQVSRHKTQDEPRYFRLGRDKRRHETSFKCLRHETVQDSGSKT